MINKKLYLPEIDFFRGFAVLIVILYHIPQTILPGGLAGVTIFFVISGFLMAKNSVRDEESFSITQFYLKRIKRIYPFMLFTLIFFILLFGILNPRLIGDIKGELPSLLLGYNNWWQLHTGVSYFDSYLNSSLFKHYWSLAVELQFYLIWPFIFLVSTKANKKGFFKLIYILTFTSIITAAFLHTDTSYYNTLARLFPFLFGILAYFNKEYIIFVFKKNSLIKGWFLFLIIVMLVIFPIEIFTINESIISICVAILLAAIDDPDIAKKLLFKKLQLHWVGQISYELYLVHFPIFIALANFFKTTRFSYANFLYIPVAFICTELLFQVFKLFTKNIRSKKLWLITPLLVMDFSAFVLAAPTSRLTNDQQDLKALLAKNANQLKKYNKQIENKQDQNKNQDKNKNDEKKQATDILFIGDSVMLGASAELLNIFDGQATVDAEESRQIVTLADFLASYKGLDHYKKIVIGLGTNGLISTDSIDKIMALLKDKQVYWINIKVPRDWEASINKTLETLPSSYPNLTLINWYDASHTHSEYFYDDDIHLNGTGRSAYAKLLHSIIN